MFICIYQFVCPLFCKNVRCFRPSTLGRRPSVICLHCLSSPLILILYSEARPSLELPLLSPHAAGSPNREYLISAEKQEWKAASVAKRTFTFPTASFGVVGLATTVMRADTPCRGGGQSERATREASSSLCTQLRPPTLRSGWMQCVQV